MPAASEIHILLVEDYKPMLKVTIRILNDLGYSNVTSATWSGGTGCVGFGVH